MKEEPSWFNPSSWFGSDEEDEEGRWIDERYDDWNADDTEIWEIFGSGTAEDEKEGKVKTSEDDKDTKDATKDEVDTDKDSDKVDDEKEDEKAEDTEDTKLSKVRKHRK